jgi:hypothetical protein
MQTAYPLSWPELASRSQLLSFCIPQVFLVIIKYSLDYPPTSLIRLSLPTVHARHLYLLSPFFCQLGDEMGKKLCWVFPYPLSPNGDIGQRTAHL